MSAIAGLYQRDGAPVNPGQVDAMSAALAHRGPDGAGAWCDGPIGLAHRMLHTTQESTRERQPLDRAGLVLVADARIDNRDDLRRLLGVARQAEPTDADLILLAYRRWGRDCPAQLIGDFAFALWDSHERLLFCARDPMGVKPFYYYRSDRVFAFASEIKALLRLPEVPREVNERQVAGYLEWNLDDRDGTLYQHIHRLPAAHAMTVTSGQAAQSAYWRLDPDRELRYATADQYAEEFREIFVEAVRARLRSVAPIGAALSGGLDSSSIVCVARRLAAGGAEPRLHAFSLVFPELPDPDLRAIDERGYVESVVRGGGVRAHRVRGDRLTPLTDVRRMLWHLDEPYFAPNAYLHWALYGAAAGSGARVFLDGLDGDTTVSHGFGRLEALAEAGPWSTFEAEIRAYARHRGMDPGAVLRHFGLPQLAALARRGRWIGWSRAAAELTRRFHLSPGRVALRWGLLPLLPPGLLGAWRAVRGRGGGESSVLHRALARQAAHRVATAAGGRRPHPRRGERESHWQGLIRPLYQLTLETADKCAAAFGLEPRYPFFDRRLMEFCLALPAEQKFAGGWSRLVLRRAMEGILPPEVQWRSSKANLAPNFHRRFRAVDRPIVEAVEPSAMGRYVNGRAFHEIRRRYFESRSPGPADPDGYLLFRATVLALWLTERGQESEGQVAPPSVGAAA